MVYYCHELLVTHISHKHVVHGSACLWIFIEIMVHMNHRTQIMQCQQDFHMQRIDHHTLVLSYLDIFRPWQKNKNYNTELDIKKKPQIPFTTVMLG